MVQISALLDELDGCMAMNMAVRALSFFHL